jgi:hypothetical protein
MCAVLGWQITQPSRPWLWVGSYRADERFASWRGPGDFALPPNVHVQQLGPDATTTEVVRRHRDFARTQQPEHGLVHLASLDDVVAQFTAWDENLFAWRAAQPPDELLDADLRAVLGDRYERVGKRLARRLRDDLPQATALRL